MEKVNAERGRGGITAAGKKFGVTLLTISKWMSDQGAGLARSGNKRKGGTARSETLREMLALARKMEPLEKELRDLEQQYEQLKRRV